MSFMMYGLCLNVQESRGEIIERIAKELGKKKSMCIILDTFKPFLSAVPVSVGKYEQVFPITSARVPIVKFFMSEWCVRRCE